jgi:tetratricopeptide (TPR) repeat protein
VAVYRNALEERTRDRVPLEWAMTQHALGRALCISGDRENSTARLKDGIAAWDKCLTVARSAWLPEHLKDLLSRYNFVQAKISDLDRRLRSAREAAEPYRRRVAARPGAFTPNLARALSLNDLASRLSELGRREEALVATQEMAELFRALAAARPETFAPSLVASLNSLANRLSELGRREEALAATQEAAKLNSNN